MRKYLGLYKGTLAGLLLKKPFEKYYENLLENISYDNYIIADVADTNIPEIKLYRNLGSEEYDRTEMSGVDAKNNRMNYLVSFECCH